MTTNNPTDMDLRELARIAATSETPPALVVYAIPNGDGDLASDGLSLAIGVEGLTPTEIQAILNRAVDIAVEEAEKERDGSGNA